MNIFVESDPNYYKYVEELDIASLWRGQISDVAIESQMKQWGTNYNVTLVISHCDKPIGWIWEDFIQTMNIFVEPDPNYNIYVEELDIASLWRGQISDVAIESQMKQWGTNYNVTVVISHCDKPIGWIWEDFIPKDFEVDSTYVYTKCGNDVEGAPQDAQIIVLPNVGRCDHTYAYHMARLDSDHAANNNVVLFLKDNDYRNDDGREFFELMQITSLNGFACNERSASYYQDKSSAYHNYDYLATFKIGHYLRESRDEDSEETFISEYQNLGAWHEDLNLNLPKPLVQVCYGGIFAALKSQIRERRETWPVMEKSLTRGNNIEEGHFSERSWGALLAKPLSPQATDWLLSLKPEVHPCKGKSIWSMRCGPLLFHCE
eukprot:CAMPEP_0197841166 /NCGR_PEP_ID=MMETSP1437-20131217/46020_1 /TAXON_ID=49252 ORGANISM="Eucampia antarctica, Strain CCMP1452" /NCGR_SAMPLE_ID=MMETSP1437 /ASSEMBLY_ACC=CAM_ASM_001096 /LENGTH=375 /DNA_ID=CAMNT_0043450877 /DNA_START=189 /DNA_END=1313 /DNA_ORIENTATION=-